MVFLADHVIQATVVCMVAVIVGLQERATFSGYENCSLQYL